MIPNWLTGLNTFVWVGSNILIAYSALLLIIFVIFYFVVFDPRATTAGKFIFRFIVSLVGVIALAFIGSFIDPIPGRLWFQYPGDVIWWRPVVRFGVYFYVAFSITALTILLGIRKWRPSWMRTALDRELVKTRKPDLPDHLNEEDSHSGSVL